MVHGYGNSDEPYALRSEAEREVRRRLLRAPHIAALTEFVDRLRIQTGRGLAIPYIDPLDGGVAAPCLLLLEAPGPRAVETGFVSRNNPDPAAKNMCLLLREAGVPRKDTLLWNIVPWYLGAEGVIRPAKAGDIVEGLMHLLTLLPLLERLRSVVLLGRKAQSARASIAGFVTVPIFNTYHPANRVLNRRPKNRQLILRELKRVRTQLTNQHPRKR